MMLSAQYDWGHFLDLDDTQILFTDHTMIYTRHRTNDNIRTMGIYDDKYLHRLINGIVCLIMNDYRNEKIIFGTTITTMEYHSVPEIIITLSNNTLHITAKSWLTIAITDKYIIIGASEVFVFEYCIVDSVITIRVQCRIPIVSNWIPPVTSTGSFIFRTDIYVYHYTFTGDLISITENIPSINLLACDKIYKLICIDNKIYYDDANQPLCEHKKRLNIIVHGDLLYIWSEGLTYEYSPVCSLREDIS